MYSKYSEIEVFWIRRMISYILIFLSVVLAMILFVRNKKNEPETLKEQLEESSSEEPIN